MIVAAPDHARLLAAAARAASGARHAEVRAERRGQALCVETPRGDDAAALVEMAQLTLRLLGASAAARRLDEAFVSALPGLRLALPYCRELDEREFLAELRTRVGDSATRRRSSAATRDRKRPMLRSVGQAKKT